MARQQEPVREIDARDTVSLAKLHEEEGIDSLDALRVKYPGSGLILSVSRLERLLAAPDVPEEHKATIRDIMASEAAEYVDIVYNDNDDDGSSEDVAVDEAGNPLPPLEDSDHEWDDFI